MADKCGSCTMCCKLMGVVELEKPTDTWCGHCDKKQGCTVYDSRPQTCRDFECLWLRSHTDTSPDAIEPFPLDMRPDRSRVVIDLTAGGEALIAHVDPDFPGAWQRGTVGRFIKRASLTHALFIRTGPGRRVVGPKGEIERLVRIVKETEK